MTQEAARQPRFEALDVLRGLAALGMAFSGMVPYQTLPAWMYHAQLPPPSRDFNPNIFGLTWVDLVFPMFLFAMGAAIPLALDGRVERGESNFSILKGLLGRGLMLAVYALVGQHLRPFVLAATPGLEEWIISLVGFVLIGLMMVRWPDQVSRKWRTAGTIAGWVGAAIVVAFWNYPDDTRGFANYRNDVILMVLANVAVSGGAIWLWTRKVPAVRWAIFAGLVAIFLTSELPGLAKTIWNWDPTEYLSFKSGPYGRFLPILYHFEYHKYLLIVLPGTFVGDLIRRTNWHPATVELQLPKWTRAVVLWSGPVAIVIACVGLLAREVPLTTAALTALVFTVLRLGAKTDDPAEELAHRLVLFATPLLLVGLLAEPIGGGIRKDSATISYFLVTSGLSCLLLASLALAGVQRRKYPIPTILSDGDEESHSTLAEVATYSGPTPNPQPPTPNALWRVTRDTGTNPILGYLVITNLVWGIVGVTQVEAAINSATDNPLVITAWGLIKTVFVACITAWFTRRKLFLRA